MPPRIQQPVKAKLGSEHMTDNLNELKAALNSKLDRWQQLQNEFDAAPESHNPELRNKISALSSDITSLDGKIAQIIRNQNM